MKEFSLRKNVRRILLFVFVRVCGLWFFVALFGKCVVLLRWGFCFVVV